MSLDLHLAMKQLLLSTSGEGRYIKHTNLFNQEYNYVEERERERKQRLYNHHHKLASFIQTVNYHGRSKYKHLYCTHNTRTTN